MILGPFTDAVPAELGKTDQRNVAFPDQRSFSRANLWIECVSTSDVQGDPVQWPWAWHRGLGTGRRRGSLPCLAARERDTPRGEQGRETHGDLVSKVWGE